jgi:hypothetical protein
MLGATAGQMSSVMTLLTFGVFSYIFSLLILQLDLLFGMTLPLASFDNDSR